MKSIASVLSAAALGAAMLLQPGVAHAAVNYVALGDSYASGVGTRSYDPSSGNCQRSTKAYPYLDATRLGANLTFVACSGARVADVTNNQLSAVTSAANRVTVQVGGNDAGFSSVITECAKPAWLGNCDTAINNSQATIKNTLPGRLNGLYAAIKSRASSAKIIVVGYPRLFNGTDCNAGTFFSAAEMTRLNQTADLLNTTIKAAANAAGYVFVDPTSKFIGHAVCGNPEWINGLSNPVSESYHPNVTGQAQYAALVAPALT
ncbi:SGNH/GDSL hydrolase family protein [Kribbella sandramycini]|uniref:Lysophospholipase L1-like esterase n=1 Tax=Kribbella sandramycini TaxID=60450 RepID=A0A7Y4KYC3_9ACTN|nr:SGNH/GDSL hydrolase family protein [Kribbella sandramycini]MBB6569231.1 lysophospholipase L1-like esterase [Kribbella sandramycini]NOL40928.1 SGNH/GDSL hydrolase family protein [Kribbella sandramycini]